MLVKKNPRLHHKSRCRLLYRKDNLPCSYQKAYHLGQTLQALIPILFVNIIKLLKNIIYNHYKACIKHCCTITVIIYFIRHQSQPMHYLVKIYAFLTLLASNVSFRYLSSLLYNTSYDVVLVILNDISFLLTLTFAVCIKNS